MTPPAMAIEDHDHEPCLTCPCIPMAVRCESGDHVIAWRHGGPTLNALCARVRKDEHGHP